MTSVIIDRRKSDKGKSSVNRRKFIDRVRGNLKESVKDLVRDGNLQDLAGSGGKRVKIPIRDLKEPTFHHDGTGINDIVVPGNTRHIVGDKIKRPPQGNGGGGPAASADGEGEDMFTFHLTKEEFLDIFFENCALPDMVKESMAVLTEEVIQRSGFTSDGSPSMMNIMRSMRNSKSRRSGLKANKQKKLKELEAKQRDLIADIHQRQTQGVECTIEQDALKQVEHDIEVLKRRLKAIPYIDPIDLRYNNWSKADVPKVQAVVFCVMDVSGSMDERKKALAKTFHILLYLFLMKEYEHIAIEYIPYHTRAWRATEQEFYYGHETGGTMTSAGLELTYDTIMEHYSPSLWNIYIAHASDGDNFPADDIIVENIIRTKLLPIVQYYAYVEITPDTSYGWGSSTKLYDVLKPIGEEMGNLCVAKIDDEASVYPVFVKLFERKK